MNKRTLISYGRIFFGTLGIIAIATQLVDSVHQGRDIVNFFSFFTIQSNILGAIILLFVGVGTLAKKPGTPQFAFIRGAATLYMVMTGVIFALLLSGLAQTLQTTIPWVNSVLHYVMPIVILADWLLYPPRSAIGFKKALWWLTYPLAYLLYSWMRGSLIHWYPYPFLNPEMNGWPQVVLTCAVVAIGITGVIKLITLHSGKRK